MPHLASVGTRRTVALSLSLVVGVASALLDGRQAGATPSLAQWLAGQRANRCFPWFLSGIGETVVPFDAANVNAAKNTDRIDDGDVLFSASIERVGSDTLRVLYDPSHALALFDHRSGDAREEYLLTGVSAPPRDVTTSDLSRLHSDKGVRLGMSLAAVVKTATNHPIRSVRACGLDAVVVQSNGVDCTNERDFIFRERRLIAFGIGGNC